MVYSIYHGAKDAVVADFIPLNRVTKLGCKYPQWICQGVSEEREREQ